MPAVGLVCVNRKSGGRVIGERSLDVSQLFGELANQLRHNVVLTIGVIGATTAITLAAEAYVPAASMFVDGAASLIAQYFVTRLALASAGLLPADAPGRFGSYWGMNIITNICIALGCLLLILPGLYLAARWFVASPVIIAEDRTAGEGMSESSELVRQSVWHVMGAILVLSAVGFGAALLPFFFYVESAAPLTVRAASAACLNGTSVLGWLMAVGFYRLVGRPEQSLEEVFA